MGLLQVMLEVPDTLTENEAIAGDDTVNVVLALHPPASVTVAVIVPTVNPEAMEPVPVGVTVPGVGDHETVKPPAVAPPLTVAVDVPGGYKQEGCVVFTLMFIGDKADIATVVVICPQAASFTVTV